MVVFLLLLNVKVKPYIISRVSLQSSSCPSTSPLRPPGDRVHGGRDRPGALAPAQAERAWLWRGTRTADRMTQCSSDCRRTPWPAPSSRRRGFCVEAVNPRVHAVDGPAIRENK